LIGWPTTTQLIMIWTAWSFLSLDGAMAWHLGQ
jgi:hypothetical protein